MASILSRAFPNKAPHFLAHLKTVVKAARNFEGTTWATYDMVIRRQAANRGSLDWSVVDSAAYNEAFTGRARLIPWCSYCLADTHAAHECFYAPEDVKPPGGPSTVAVPEQWQGRSPARATQPSQQR